MATAPTVHDPRAARRPIEHLGIERFRGLRDVTLAELGRVNVIVGGNDAGKTTVLEALRLAASPYSPYNWISAGHRDEPMFTPGMGIRLLFPATGSPADAADEAPPIVLRLRGALSGFEASYDEVLSLAAEPQATPAPTHIVSVRPFGQVEPLLSSSNRADAHDNPSVEVRGGVWTMTLRASGQMQFPNARPLIPVVWRFVHDSDLARDPTRWFSEQRMAGRTERLVELLQLLDPRVRSVEILKPGHFPQLYVTLEGGTPLPLSVYGHGLRQAIRLALTVEEARGGIALIDEVDSAIHYSAMKDVFAWLLHAAREADVQLFVTTHSLEAIDAIVSASENAEPGELVGYRLERHEGQTIARRLEGRLLRRLRLERGLEVR